MRAAEHRARLLDALGSLRRGDTDSALQAELTHRLPPGSLRREFGSQAAATGRTNSGTIMRVVTPSGPVITIVASQAERELNSSHWHALNEAVRTGNAAFLVPFAGQTVAGLPLLTDLSQARVMDDAGLLEGGPYPESGRAGSTQAAA